VASVVCGIRPGADSSDILALRLGMSLAPSSPMALCLSLIRSAAGFRCRDKVELFHF
jgi:hypothetical protein